MCYYGAFIIKYFESQRMFSCFLRQWSGVGSALHKRLGSIFSSNNGIKYMPGNNSLHLLLNEVRNLALLTQKNVLISADLKQIDQHKTV